MNPSDLTAPILRRPSRTASGVLAGSLAGLLVAVIVVPDHEETKPPGVAALEAAKGSGGAVTEGLPAAAGTETAAAAVGGAPAVGGATTAAPRATARGQATPSSGAAATSAPVDNTKLPNGGATARGVTATEIKVGVASIDPGLIAPICPTCDPKQAKEGKPAEALIAAWTRDGVLPVNGRTIKPINRIVALTAEEQRSACTFFAQEAKPFLVVTGAGTSGTGACLAGEHKMAVVDPWGGYKETTLQQNYPLIHTVAPSASRILRNFVYWAEDNGLLKGHTLGMYSYDDSVSASSALGVDPYLDQPSLTKHFRDVLTQKGYKLAIDFVANQGQEAAAVARFKGANVDVLFLWSGHHDFQTQAKQQAYKPRYPVTDTSYTLGDANGTSYFDPDQMDGQIAMGVRTWPKNWVQRKPATPPADDKAAAYCLKAYSDYTKQTLDTIGNSSEISLTLDICSGLEVVRAASEAAGPNLTVERFIGGLQTIKNMQTSEYALVSFGPGRYAGSDNYSNAQYNKNRWQPGNELFSYVTPWRPMWVP